MEELFISIGILGLLLDIAGSFFVLKGFFSLRKEGTAKFKGKGNKLYVGEGHPNEMKEEEVSKISTRLGEINEDMTANDMVTYLFQASELSKVSKGMPEGLKEEILIGRKNMEKSITHFFSNKLGRDALRGFILLATGFSLQIISQLYPLILCVLEKFQF